MRGWRRKRSESGAAAHEEQCQQNRDRNSQKPEKDPPDFSALTTHCGRRVLHIGHLHQQLMCQCPPAEDASLREPQGCVAIDGTHSIDGLSNVSLRAPNSSSMPTSIGESFGCPDASLIR